MGSSNGSPAYSREALIEWVRHNDPDARFGHASDEEYFARFTWNGEIYEFEATGPDAREQIARTAAETMRGAMGLPPLHRPDERDSLTQRIVQASLAGDEEQATRLTNELVKHRATNARRLAAKTNFTKREIW